MDPKNSLVLILSRSWDKEHFDTATEFAAVTRGLFFKPELVNEKMG